MRVAACLLAAATVFAGCVEPGVVRIVDGRPEMGRYISEAAYAYYVRGAEAEDAGRLDLAERAYQLASEEDPASPEIWTRLGAVYCRQAAHEGVTALPSAASLAFQRGLLADGGYGPLYRERARCLLRRGAGAAAAEDAERALALDPDDLDTALVRAEALERTGHLDDARRALRASAVRRPRAAAPWSALLALARRSHDAPLAHEAALQVAALASPPLAGGSPELSPLAAIDSALRAGDLAEAQRRALHARVPGAEVALRAAALGLAAPAREQAALILGADPANASARIALAAAANLRGDVSAVGEAMQSLPQHSTPPSPLGRLLLAEVLGRRVDVAAARAWLGPEPAPNGDDPLLAATSARVRAALAAP